MPFIKKERRKTIDDNGGYVSEKWTDIQPGDRCYAHYKRMVDRWRENPRWTTAHEIYMDVGRATRHPCNKSRDEICAMELAWQVFFIKWVMPYEREKCDENGDI